MEKTIFSSINERWRFCTCAFFLGFVTLLFMINYNSSLLSVQHLGISPPISPNIPVTKLPVVLEEPPPDPIIKEHRRKNKQIVKVDDDNKCNLFEGKWVYNPEVSPIYDAAKCPFLGEQVSCQRNGRPDFDYERWTWEPQGCDIPRHNIGKDMLEKLRGKRMVIVGDSLNRNQFESMACLLYTSLNYSSQAHVDVNSGSYKVLKSKECDCSVEFYWNPFLVKLEEKKSNGAKILKLDKLADSAKKWKGADIMVFNTGHWWVHRGKLQAWDYFQYKGKKMENMETEEALALAMKTWARWIEKTVNTTKTRVFFRSISPSHKGSQWCYNETKPNINATHVTVFPEKMMQIVERTIREMKTRVTYLNITKLSQYRKDAHPSIYRTKQGKNLIETHEKQPGSWADCNHWCVPGLPDTWNRLIFASIPLEISKDISPS